MLRKDGPPDGWQRTALLPAAVILVSILLISHVSADEAGLTRGSRFTITVTGTPNTPYYVWLTNTHTMSGEPGNQPPVLLANQANIVKDPADGPYVIGSYQYNNGGGQTIRQNVAPSTPSMSSTNYYALVTTDDTGRALVAFQTSSNTATRTFSVKVENPQSVAKDNIQVQRGDVGVRRGTVGFDTVSTLPVRTVEPTPEILPVTETFMPIRVTMEPLPLPTATTAHPVPSGMGICIAALGTVLLAERKSA